MTVSLKCQYALRAIFELARNETNAPEKIADIGRAQGIPIRFLENILHELKRAGIVRSFRGKYGGYILADSPSAITAGDIIRCIEGPPLQAGCITGKQDGCPSLGDCVFLPMWERLQHAITDIYDSTTFEDLVTQSHAKAAHIDYVI
jgi:Rrf2 family cysteine metabolism transcriptional repressor